LAVVFAHKETCSIWTLSYTWNSQPLC
jgi:hypothetical protein